MERSICLLHHGLLIGRCCESQLLDPVHVWNKSMEDRKSVDVLFLDISKAIDKVPHVYLSEKLKMVGIDGNLLSWIHDYLTNRRQRCIVEGCVSGWLPCSNFWCSPRDYPWSTINCSFFTLMTLQTISLLRWLFLLMTVSCLGRFKPRGTNWNCRKI